MPKSVLITYFVHGTTVENEKDLSSGWNDCELSELGKKQSIDLTDQIKDKQFDVVFCSDLRRAVDSAELTFGNRIPIVRDQRLRECNYGDFTQKPSDLVDEKMKSCINQPFPNGESYHDVEKRMKSFLDDLVTQYPGKRVAIVAHRAPQLALDVLLKKKSWEQAMKEDWRLKTPKEWKPGWEYKLNV